MKKLEVDRIMKAVAKIESILRPYKRLNREMILRVASILYGK